MTATTHNSDLDWSALVADYRAKRDAWAKCDPTAQELAAYHAALAALPTAEIPPFGPELPAEMQEMTVGGVIAMATLENAPPEAKAWAAWWNAKEERDKGRADLRQRYLGAADARQKAANLAYSSALDALAAYRVSNLTHLAQKIEIVDQDYDEADVPHECLAELLTDVRRLAGMGLIVPSNASAWRAAEDALAKAEADLEALAEPYTDAECDRLADIQGDAIDAILALPATTTAQAIRKLELAMFDEQMVRTGVDYPALLADAKRLAAREA